MTIRNLTNTDTFGEWKDLTNEVIDFVNNLGITGSGGSGISLGEDLVPETLGLDLGNTTNYFEELYTKHLYVNSTGVFVNTTIIPVDNFTYDLGVPGFQFNDIYSSYLISNNLGLFTSYFTSNSSYFTSNLSVVPATDGELELGTQDLGWNAVFLSNVSAVFFDVDTSGLTRVITRDDNSDSMYIGDNTGTGIFVNATQVTVSGSTTTYFNSDFVYTDSQTIDVNYSGLSTDDEPICGIQVVEDGDYVGWITTSPDRTSWEMVAPSSNGVIIFTPPLEGASYFNMQNFSGGSLNLDQGLSSESDVTFNDLDLTGNLTVYNVATLNTVTIEGVSTFDGASNFDGAATFTKNITQTAGAFSTSGAATLSGTATLSGPTTTISSATTKLSGTTTSFSGGTVNFGNDTQVNFNASGGTDVRFNSNVSFVTGTAINGDVVIGNLLGDGSIPDPPAATLTVYGPAGFTGNVSVNGYLTLTQPITIPEAEDGTPMIFEGDVEFWTNIRQPNTAIANLSSLYVWNDAFEHQIVGTVNVGSLLVDGSTTTGGALTISGALRGVTSLTMGGNLTGVTGLTMSGQLNGATKVITSALDVSGDLKIKGAGVLTQEDDDSLNTLAGALLISNTVTANSTSEQMALEVVGGVIIREDLYVNGSILGSIKSNPGSTDPAAFGDYGDGEADLDPSAAATQISPTGALTLGLPPNAALGRPGRKKRAEIKPDGSAQFMTMGALDDDDPINGVSMNSSGYLFFGKANSTYLYGNNTYLEGFVNNGNFVLSTNNGDINLQTTNGSISFLSNTQFYSDTTVNTITAIGSVDLTGTTTLNTTSIVGSTTVANTIEFNKLALFQDGFRANGTFIVEKNAEFSQDVTISGNLTVLGAQVTINAASLAVEDAIMVLNHGALDANTVLSQDAGFLIENAEDLGEALAVFYDKSEDRVCIAYTNSVHTDTTLVVTKYANMHAGVIHGEELMSSNTLMVTGVATFSNNVTVVGSFTAGTLNTDGVTVGQDLSVGGALEAATLAISSTSTLGGILTVTGNTVLSSRLTVGGNQNVVGNLVVDGSISVNGTSSFSSTLGVSGAATLFDTLYVGKGATLTNTLSVTGATTLSNTLVITGETTVNDNLIVKNIVPAANIAYDLGTPDLRFRDLYLSGNTLTLGGATLGATEEGSLSTGGGDFTVDGNIITTGGLDINTSSTLANTLGVTGATTLANTLGVTGATTLANTLGVTGATTLSDTLDVTGATTLANTLGVTGATTLANTLGVTGATTLSDTLDVTGATTLSDTLGVTGATTLANTLSVGGNTVIGGGLEVTGQLTTSSTINVIGDMSSNTLTTNSITISTIDIIPTVKTNKIYAIGQELWYNGDVLLIQEMSEPTSPATATATVNTTSGLLENVTLDGGGSGYQSSPIVYIIGGGATEPARVTANVSAGSVTSFSIDDAGAGYSSTPDVVFVGGGSEPVTFGEGTFNIDNLVEGSSSKIKHNIESINNIDYNKFMSLNPVSYVKNSNNKKEVGFIAEEVFNLYPELVGFDKKGNISGLQYTRLIPYMIKVIQEQQNTIDGLKTKLEIKD